MPRARKLPWFPVVAGSVVVLGLGVGVLTAGSAWWNSEFDVQSDTEKATLARWSERPTWKENTKAKIDTTRPIWAPADAHDISLQYRIGYQDQIAVVMRSATGLDLSGCRQLPAGTDVDPAVMESPYLPSPMPKRVWTCGDGRAVWQHGGLVYGWSTQWPLPEPTTD